MNEIQKQALKLDESLSLKMAVIANQVQSLTYYAENIFST